MQQTVIAPKKILNVPYQIQQKPMWCWAAVGTNCTLYYKPDSGWTQCKMATNAIIPSPGDCCTSPASDSPGCARTWYINNGKGLGSFVTGGIDNGLKQGAISFADLTKELDAGNVVAYCIHFDEYEGFKNLNHFVLVTAYDNSDAKMTITISDPFFGISEISYNEFISHYKSEGVVSYTFFTKPGK